MHKTTAFNLSRFARSLLVAIALSAAAFTSSASVFVSVNFAPPPIPVYEQPLCPGPGYIWAPGYWAYGPDGYYWVPGTWVLAPFVGALWTPGYWGWTGAVYVWHPGYWGTHVGYYGGIDYGFGYFGTGYVGGYWRDRTFYYNTSVTHVDTTTVQYTYNRPERNVNVSRVSFNGGPGGTTARPTAQDRIAEREAHRSSTPIQLQHERLASRDRGLLASVNHGSPALAATPRAAAFERSEFRGRAAGAEPRNAPSNVARAPREQAQRSFEFTRRGREPGPPSTAGSAPTERGAPRVATPRIESRPELHAQERPHPQATPRIEARPPRTEMRAEARPHSQAAPRMEPRREARVQNMERPQAAPHRQAMPAPEMRAQNMPHPQAAPRMQAGPRPEMHAQGQPHEGRGGQGRREEHGGG
jgi:hypothetical protein